MQADLKSRLIAVAEAHAAAHEAALSRAAKQVAGDANFFDRLANGGGLRLATLERFASFFADPGNWPVGEDGAAKVPAEAVDLAHATGVSAAGAGLSAGNCGDLSQGEAA